MPRLDDNSRSLAGYRLLLRTAQAENDLLRGQRDRALQKVDKLRAELAAAERHVAALEALRAEAFRMRNGGAADWDMREIGD